MARVRNDDEDDQSENRQRNARQNQPGNRLSPIRGRAQTDETGDDANRGEDEADRVCAETE